MNKNPVLSKRPLQAIHQTCRKPPPPKSIQDDRHRTLKMEKVGVDRDSVSPYDQNDMGKKPKSRFGNFTCI